MKLYFFYGPGQVAKNNKISEIKKEFDPLSIVEVNDLSQIETASLFSEKRLAIVEDLADLDISKLPEDDNLTLIIKLSKRLPSNSTILKNLPKGATVVPFEEAEETSIFPLVDFLSEKNPKALSELEKYLNEWGSQYVLTMMAYSLRRFIQRNKNLPPFVLKKIESQKRNFSLSRTSDLYRAIIETDYKIKQGLLDEKVGVFMLAEKFLTD